jgi:hypothetical protein
MVDAEYTYMNPALNLLTLAMMLNYNQETPLHLLFGRELLNRGYKKLNYLKFDCRILFNMSSPSVFVL